MNLSHIIAMALAGTVPLSTLPAQTSAPAPTPAPAAGAAPASTIVGPAYYVSDIKRSLAFYRDTLGMTVRMQFGPKDHPDVIVGFGTDLRLPSLMLLSDRESSTPGKIEHAHGYDRVALNVPDLRGLQARLHAAGYRTDGIRTVHGIVLMTMATDPDGYKVELVQAPPMPVPSSAP